MTWIREHVIAVLRWLLTQLEPAKVVLETVGVLDPVLARAVALTLEQDQRWPERSGEAKRHQVWSQLRKEFADASGKAISRAIEDALF
jgi:hypothetical protein